MNDRTRAMREAAEMVKDELGGTLGLGPVVYSGSRDELNHRMRIRDDEIDRLRSLNADMLEALEESAHVLELVRSTPADRWSGLVIDGAIKDARASIAKAKGEK